LFCFWKCCSVDSEFHHHPGAIEAIAQNPADADQVTPSFCVFFLKLAITFDPLVLSSPEGGVNSLLYEVFIAVSLADNFREVKGCIFKYHVI